MPGGPRVAVDVAAVRAEPTGVGSSVRELAAALVAVAPERVGFIGVRRGGAIDAPTFRPAIAHHGGRYVPWLELRAERAARALGAGMVHYTSAIAPLSARLPFVVTLYDLSVLRDPLHHPPLRVARVLWMALAVQRARAVIVPSRATARDVERGLLAPAGRVVVVPLAPVRGVLPGTRDGDAAVLARHRVTPGGYVLATGGLDERKNPLRVVQALERLTPARPELGLVIAGPRGFRASSIEAAIRASPVAHRIRVVGYVSDVELGALMRNAAAFSFVSLHEGYGLPILEAMSAGVPVVTSRLSSMPEVAGRAAVLVDPRDVGAIARGLDEALRGRPGLADAGLARAAARAWRDVAEETLDVYTWAAAR